MIMLKDGLLAITYGYRPEPYGIRARLSSDKKGQTCAGTAAVGT